MRRKQLAHFLINMADEFDQDGEFVLADQIDENFNEFLNLLENGKITFNYEFSGGFRDPRLPYSQQSGSSTLPAVGVPGPQ